VESENGLRPAPLTNGKVLNMMDLFIIDGIGPFFRDCDQDVINWSKAPFTHLEKGEGLDPERCQ